MKIKGFFGKITAAVAFSLSLLVFGVTVIPATPAHAATSTASKADRILAAGNQYLGTPYRFGAKSGNTSSFDCSSFVQHIFKQNGISLPRSSRQQAATGEYVPLSQLRKGDLIFFRSSGSSSNRITHVAVYAGNGKILHTYGKPGVKYSDFSGNWKARYVTSKRVI